MFPVRILLLEDNDYDRHLMEAKLTGEGIPCELTQVKSEEEFRARLGKCSFDLIISDFTLPTYTGMAALGVAKELQPDIPFIFVSGTIGEERAIEGLKAGATDYILKDRWHRLGQAVRRAMREAQARAERRQMEQQVRLQSSALEAVANGIMLTDKNGKILFVNKSFCEMTGYTADEVLGQTPRLLNSGKHDREFFDELWRTILAGQVWQGELFNRRKDGNIFPEEMAITPLFDSSGVVTHFVAVKQNVSKRKLLEEQLRQAQKMEGIGQLAGGVAHDFNNLLQVINGNLELALRANEPPQEFSRHCMKQAIAAAERAANLVRQLLYFSRKQAAQFQSFNLNSTIENLTKMINRIIGENVSLRCAYGNPLPPIFADIGMIEQVLINLIINARDAMPRGGSLSISTQAVTITESDTKLRPTARAGEFICISVCDTGTGIPPEQLPRIFEPFFTTKEAGKGTGLGLATAYGIIQQHHGWFEVASRVGHGTDFRIFLPVQAIRGEKPVAPKTNTYPVGKSEKILLVEDDREVRTFLRYILEAWGYQICDAANSTEALAIWKSRNGRFDLMLTDVAMPGISGKELAGQLITEQPDLKVVLMSGYSPEIVGELPRSMAFLQKPCTIATLTETVKNCLSGEAQSR